MAGTPEKKTLEDFENEMPDKVTNKDISKRAREKGNFSKP